MRPKKGKVPPKVGKVLHKATGDNVSDVDYVQAIACALKEELGSTHQAIKSAMRWTGASERTVKYWFSGTAGPNGEHLIALARHSDLVLQFFLRKAGRQPYIGALHLVGVRETLQHALNIIQDVMDANGQH